MGRKEKHYYRLPDGSLIGKDGTLTTDADLYCREWTGMIKFVEELTGWKCYGFDPGFSLSDPKNLITVSLSLDFVRALKKGLNENYGIFSEEEEEIDKNHKEE